jgi:hypothetical protein
MYPTKITTKMAAVVYAMAAILIRGIVKIFSFMFFTL